MIDYHIHTSLCNHAKCAMIAYVQKAVEKGFTEICFLDHLTVREKEYPLSMSRHEVPFYYHAIQQIKQDFEDKITIRTGLEVDFNPSFIPLIEDIIGTFSFDMIGSSLHFPEDIDVVSRRSDWGQGKLDPDNIHERYLEQLDRMLDFNYFDVICHIDLLKKYGKSPSRSFESEMDMILKKIGIKGIAVEVNTSGINHIINEVYPSPDILNKCYDTGIPLTIGSDAHHPDEIGRHFDRTIETLLSLGHTHLATFEERTCKRVPIKDLI